MKFIKTYIVEAREDNYDKLCFSQYWPGPGRPCCMKTGRIKVYLRERGDVFPLLDEICIFYWSYFGQISTHIPQTESNISPQCISTYLTKPEQLEQRVQ